MSEHIVEYEIVASKNRQSLVQKVNTLIALQQGWEPQGGISYAVDTQQFAQAVVRYEPAVVVMGDIHAGH